jgi:hypothetical protein
MTIIRVLHCVSETRDDACRMAQASDVPLWRSRNARRRGSLGSQRDSQAESTIHEDWRGAKKPGGRFNPEPTVLSVIFERPFINVGSRLVSPSFNND